MSSPKKRFLTRDELIAKLSAPPEKIIDVVGIGPVRIQVPTFPRLIELRAKCTEDDDYRMAMILASCPDLKVEDLTMLKTGNGMAIAALITAVTEVSNVAKLTDATVGKPKRG